MVESSNTTILLLDSVHFSERIIVGGLYLALSVILGVIYAPTLLIMLYTEKIRVHSSYKLMIVMGLYDMVQLVILGPLTSIYTLITSASVTDGPLKSKVPGAVALSAYFGYIVLLSLLAIERCFKTWSKTWWVILFGGHRIYFWIVASLLLLRLTRFRYAAAPVIYIALDLVVGLTASVVIIVCYLLIVVKLRFLKHSTSDANDNHEERRILYQSALLSGCLMLLLIVFHTMPYFTNNRWAFCVCQVLWIINAGINGLIYLIFNETLRKELKSKFRSTENSMFTVTWAKSQGTQIHATTT